MATNEARGLIRLEEKAKAKVRVPSTLREAAGQTRNQLCQRLLRYMIEMETRNGRRIAMQTRNGRLIIHPPRRQVP